MSEEEEEEAIYENYEGFETDEEEEEYDEDESLIFSEQEPTVSAPTPNKFRLAEWESDLLPEGYSLQPIDLSTDPDNDDFAKRLVRDRRLDVDDVFEIIDPDGKMIGTKVMPHAKQAYLDEIALDERERSNSGYSGSSGISPEDDDSEVDGESKEGLEEEEEEEEEEQEPEEPPKPKGSPSFECLYNPAEPNREGEFLDHVKQINKEIAETQKQLCLDHQKRKERLIRKDLDKQFILDHVSQIGVLYLPGNYLDPILGRRVDDADLPFIVETVKSIKAEKFTGFNLAYNQITDEGMALLAPFIYERQSIVHLNISHNDFTAQGLLTLVNYLMARKSLLTLKIAGVKVGDEGINSITCLYMCGKGPGDLDVSETDMTMPGFQALCTSFQAVDENEDYPKFLTTHELPFSLETLAQLKMENHEYLKAQIQMYHRNCLSHYEPILPKDKETRLANISEEEKRSELSGHKWMKDALGSLLEETPSIILGGEDSKESIFESELEEVAKSSVLVYGRANELPEVEDIIIEYKTITDKGCKEEENGKPVIVCPSLYRLDIDEYFDEVEGDFQTKDVELRTFFKHVNPMFMDEQVDRVIDDEIKANETDSEKEMVDRITSEKAASKVVEDVFDEAGGLVGESEFTTHSDMAQVLLRTIMDNVKHFLLTETEEGKFSDLTVPELETIWEDSLKTTHRIFNPFIPPKCGVEPDVLEMFVEEFLKISCGAFYELIKVPFFQEVFENAANIECVDSSKALLLEVSEFITEPLNLSYHVCVRDIVLKFLEEIMVRAGSIIGTGDPYNMRQDLARDSMGEFVWPSIMDITEERIAPLVDNLFDAGALLAQDALEYKREKEDYIEEMIEPAKEFLEGIFKQLTKYLIQLKDDDEKLMDRLKRYTFSTKPVRLVLNRPIFPNYEPVMAMKLARYLETNDSVKCLHIRKWRLGEDGMELLMERLINNNNIVTLDLTGNGIGSEGLKLMGLYLRQNQNLRHLILGHNGLRNPGIQIITDVLQESSLVSLNVAYNDMTSIGLDPFLEAVKGSKLYSLYILGNCFSQSTCNLINEIFETGPLRKEDCDVDVQEIDGEITLLVNSQARDINEWYEVPAAVDCGMIRPPYYFEEYTAPRLTICGAIDVEV